MTNLRKVLLAGDLPKSQWDEYAAILRQSLQTLALDAIFDVVTEHQLDQLAKPDQAYAQVEICVVAKPTEHLWLKLSRVQWVQSLWAGVDTLLASAALPKNIQLTRMVDPFMTETMSEAACTHVLWLHRQMHRYAALQRQGRWQQLAQGPADQYQIGIVGFGELGQACAKALTGLGFKVCGYRRSQPAASVFTDEIGLSQLLSISDVVINLLPLTTSTQGFFNQQRFAQFKSNASFVNLARGRHVDELALQAALDDKLEHAILDVFAVEPLPQDHWLWKHPKVTVTPHIAADSRPETVFKVVAENLRRFALGQPLQFIVEPSRGY
jgi:glyoxylate/hydroxypyruvate reductase